MFSNIKLTGEPDSVLIGSDDGVITIIIPHYVLISGFMQQVLCNKPKPIVGFSTEPKRTVWFPHS